MVGARKNKKDRWMPKRVYRGRSSYEYKPTNRETIALLPLPKGGIESEALKAQVWAEYQKVTAPRQYLIENLTVDFHNSKQFKQKSTRTQDDYLRYSQKINTVFGKMQPDNVQPLHIRKFMDKVGEEHEVTANRHHSYLSVLFSWGLERGLCSDNPAKKVRKFKEEARDRYVEQWEFDLVHKTALASSYPYVAHMMMIAYLCRMRVNEVLRLREKHILDEGVFVERGKGSDNEITKWSPALDEAVKAVRSMHPGAPVIMSRPLFHDKKGLPIQMSAYKTAWQRVIKKAQENGLEERFTFHDLKARGITNHKDGYGGHKTKKAAKIYQRKPKQIDATE